jgi:hypothetical protein
MIGGMIPSGYSRNVYSGTLRNGEEFAFGLWANEAPSSQAATQSQADAFAAEFVEDESATGNPLSLIGSDTHFERVTTYSYLDTSGHATYIAESPLVVAGTSTGDQLPNQCALVVTLNTAHAGRRNRGRIYLPCTQATLVAGQLAASAVGQVTLWWANYITALNGELGDQHIVVLSQVAGASNSVTSVRVDSRIDIQRRRAKSEKAITFDIENVT